MPIGGYFDASGKTFEPFVTLAAVFIPDALSAAFDKAWRDQLKAKSVTAWHTTDAMSCRGEFSSRSGWDMHKVCRLRNALLNVLSEFSMNGAHLSSCTVDCGAARKLRQLHPGDVPKVVQICLDHTVGAITVPSEDENKPDTIKLYFDRDEEFIHPVKKVWENARKRRHCGVLGWPQQVRSILDLPPVLRQTVKTQDPLNGELSHGIVA